MAAPVRSETIDETRARRMPGSIALHQRAKATFPDGVTHDGRYQEPFPIYCTHATGPRKWDVDGNEYVDYFGGHGALLLGHSHPAIVEAVARQAARGTHLGASHELRSSGASRSRRSCRRRAVGWSSSPPPAPRRP